MAAFIWQDWLVGILLGAGFALLVGVAYLRGIVGFVLVAATYIITQSWWLVVVTLLVFLLVTLVRDRNRGGAKTSFVMIMLLSTVVSAVLFPYRLVQKGIMWLNPRRRGMS